MKPSMISPPDRILNIRDVTRLTTLSRATVYRHAGRTFPASVRLTASGSRVGWKEQHVRDWMRDPLGWAESADAKRGQ